MAGSSVNYGKRFRRVQDLGCSGTGGDGSANEVPGKGASRLGWNRSDAAHLSTGHCIGRRDHRLSRWQNYSKAGRTGPSSTRRCHADWPRRCPGGHHSGDRCRADNLITGSGQPIKFYGSRTGKGCPSQGHRGPRANTGRRKTGDGWCRHNREARRACRGPTSSRHAQLPSGHSIRRHDCNRSRTSHGVATGGYPVEFDRRYACVVRARQRYRCADATGNWREAGNRWGQVQGQSGRRTCHSSN